MALQSVQQSSETRTGRRITVGAELRRQNCYLPLFKSLQLFPNKNTYKLGLQNITSLMGSHKAQGTTKDIPEENEAED